MIMMTANAPASATRIFTIWLRYLPRPPVSMVILGSTNPLIGASVQYICEVENVGHGADPADEPPTGTAAAKAAVGNIIREYKNTPVANKINKL